MWRVPIPLIFAAVALIGVTVTVFVKINIAVLGSYDPTWETYNGTHVVRVTAPPISSPFIYGGYGTAYFGSAVNVQYWQKYYPTSDPVTKKDLGTVIPVLVRVVSGSLPTGQSIWYTNPWNGASQVLYFTGATNGSICLIGGTATSPINTKYGLAVFCKVYTDGKGRYWLRPINSYTEAKGYEGIACNIARSYDYTYAFGLSIMDSYMFYCLYGTWNYDTYIYWYTTASGVTSANLAYTSWYKTTVSSTGYTLEIWFAPFWRVSADPGTLAIKPS